MKEVANWGGLSARADPDCHGGGADISALGAPSRWDHADAV